MKTRSLLRALLCALPLAAFAADDPSLPPPLTQPIFPALYRSPRRIAFGDAVIAANDAGSAFAEAPEKLRAALVRAWGEKAAPPIVPADSVRPGQTVILIGNGYANDFLRRLTILDLLSGEKAPKGELRTVPGSPEGRPDALCFAAPAPEALEGRIAAFLERFPKRPPSIPHFIDCADPKPAASVEAHRRRLDACYRAGMVSEGPVGTVLKELFSVADDYNLTGDDRYARLFGDEIARLRERYHTMLGARKAPPHFVFFRFPAAVDAIEESPAFTEEDQRGAGELAHRITEHILSHGDLSQPKKLYQENRRQYMTNHPVNGILSVYFAALFLHTRYGFAPAAEWRAMAEHGFSCVSGYAFGPEDSLSYQSFNLNLLMHYLVGAGKDGGAFFRSREMADYLAFCKAAVDPRGGIVAFGDGYPISSGTATGHFRRLLTKCFQFFGDADSAFYLKRIQDFHRDKVDPAYFPPIADLGKLPDRPAGKTTGLLLFPLRPYKFELLKKANVFSRPVLDKAAFRSSWDPAHSLYAYFTGINGGPHGHCDANSLCSLVIDGEEWVAERDYVKAYAPDHNRVSVILDGRSFEFPYPDSQPIRAKFAFSQILGAAESAGGKRALLSLLLEDYNGTDCRRDIFLDEARGVFLLDRITARVPGRRVAESRFQVLGRPDAVTDRDARFTRPGSEFHITLAEPAETGVFSTFESGSNAREAGYFGVYRNLGGADSAHWTARRAATLKAGESLDFVQRLKTGPATPFGRAEAGLWRSGDDVLIGRGRHAFGAFVIDADFFVLTPEGLLGTGIRQENVSRKPREALAAAPRTAAPAEPAEKSVQMPPSPCQIQTFEAPIAALAAHGDALAVGLADGTLAVGSGRHAFGREITALAAIPDGRGGVRWAVGLFPEKADSTGEVALLDAALAEQWRTAMPRYQVHRAIVRDLFPADPGGGAAPYVVAGTTAWSYLLLDPAEGSIRRRFAVLHPATEGAAGDLDGDGADEIVGGCEYYASPIWRLDGRTLYNSSNPPYSRYQYAADLDGDGRAEFYSLRGNGTLRRFRLNERGRIDAASGNTGGEALGAVIADGRLWTLSSSGILCVTDGQETRPAAELDGIFTAFNGAGGCFYALRTAGDIVKFDRTGKILARYEVPFDPAETRPTRSAAAMGGVFFSFGNKLVFVK